MSNTCLPAAVIIFISAPLALILTPACEHRRRSDRIAEWEAALADA